MGGLGPYDLEMPGTQEGRVAHRTGPPQKTHPFKWARPRLYEELSGLAFRRAAKFSESRMTCNEETK